MANAFIIHGQYNKAHEELAKFVSSIGLDVISFDRVEARIGSVETVLDKVLDGVEKAQVVIVFFTPDEQAAFHDSETNEFKPKLKGGGEGWQPRPNVLFEAGVAVGAARDRTILVKVGAVRQFSDVAGVLFVDLGESGALERLNQAIVKRVKKVEPEFKETTPISVDFSKYQTDRWNYHDELGELERNLRGVKLLVRNRTLFDVLVDYVNMTPESSWDSTSVADFHFDNYDPDPEDSSETDGIFWYLMNYGVFAFRGIDNGWDDDVLWWVNMQEYVYLTARGRALLNKVKSTLPALPVRRARNAAAKG